MKITRRQLRRLINEVRTKPNIPNIPGDDALGKVDSLARQKESQPSADSLAGAFGYPEDRSYSADLKSYDNLEAEMGRFEIEKYLPGFLNLPENIIEAVVEFVFLSKDPTLHIQLEEDILEEEIGEDMYERATNYPSRNIPENADAVEIVDSYRNNPKAHDPKFYSIYAAHGTYEGVDPFSKIDPYLDPNSQYAVHRTGDSQSGFHDGFREEYHKVTTEPNHKISSYPVEEAIIEMMRDLRPDHKEYVIN